MPRRHATPAALALILLIAVAAAHRGRGARQHAGRRPLVPPDRDHHRFRGHRRRAVRHHRRRWRHRGHGAGPARGPDGAPQVRGGGDLDQPRAARVRRRAGLLRGRRLGPDREHRRARRDRAPRARRRASQAQADRRERAHAQRDHRVPGRAGAQQAAPEPLHRRAGAGELHRPQAVPHHAELSRPTCRPASTRCRCSSSRTATWSAPSAARW